MGFATACCTCIPSTLNGRVVRNHDQPLHAIHVSIPYRFRTLHVGLNEFTELESDALEALPNLREFTVEGCDTGVDRLTVEGGAFRNNPLLETVNITKCHALDHVPSGTFATQLHLSTINLSGNQGRTGSDCPSLPSSIRNYSQAI